MRWLTAIPVYNEAAHVRRVLAEVRRFSPHIVVVNDGSADGTAELLARERSIRLLTHPINRGYGAALISAFAYALQHDFDVLVTMDCDGQHEPSRIPVLLEALDDADIVSGSRYLRDFRQDTPAPTDRRAVNMTITAEINERFGLNLTDAFCGFKAYRREAIEKLEITETGWGMPLQLWVQAARLGLRIKEIGVPRLYLDPKRAFGGVMNDTEARVAYYHRVLADAASETQPDTGVSRIDLRIVVLGAVLLSANRRYRAPTEVGVLCYPPETEIAAQLRANREAVNVDAVHIDGTPLSQFRVEAAAEVLAAARQYHRECGEPVPDFPDGPILMSGHQPELTHVGVLVKTFALHGLALRHGLTPLNLIVDNDTTKNTSLRFAIIPSSPSKPEAIHLQSVPYDHFEGEVIYERRRVLDPELFNRFADRVLPLTRNWGFEPLLPEMWAEMRRQFKRTPILGEVVSATRRTWERRWNCRNLELPLSRMCATRVFQRFVRHIVSGLPRFHAIYNESVAEYRRRNQLRSRNHPVPDLAGSGDVLEAPFWRLRPSDVRRARLMVKRGEIPDTRDLRSRALTTTMFLRVCLSDGFIHGIGGAKYDEVTDAILERWLGLKPPGFIVVTATLRLPLPTFPTTPADLHAIGRKLRDLKWNPQRYLSEEALKQPVVRQLAAEKEKLIREEPAAKIDRKAWFGKLAEATERLRPFVSEQVEMAEREFDKQRVEEKANESLIRRDFSWCLFPEEVLKRFCQRLL